MKPKLRTQRRSAPDIAIRIASPSWRRPAGIRALVRRAAEATCAAVPPAETAELCIVLTDNRAMRVLNRTWRGKDKPTNVLSFPAGDESVLGDVVIARGVAVAEAIEQGKTLEAHVMHLVVHGVLHLFGFDHEKDRDATRMEALEVRILRSLKIADPYRAPARRAA